MKRNILAAFIALALVAILGAAVSRSAGGPSGRVHHASQLITDQTATFSTNKWDLGESTKLIMTMNFTKVGGAAPDVDCVINSGENKTVGDTTGTSFTQATGVTKETKTVVDGKFHSFIWATCTMAGTITTVDVGVFVTGKP